MIETHRLQLGENFGNEYRRWKHFQERSDQTYRARKVVLEVRFFFRVVAEVLGIDRSVAARLALCIRFPGAGPTPGGKRKS